MEWTEAEAMAIVVSSVRAYGRRAKALSEAGDARTLLRDPGRCAAALRPEDLSALRTGIKAAGETLDKLRRDGVSLILPGGPGASSLLSEIRHPPHLLFCQGLADLTDPFPIACVGTRDPSDYGFRNARRIARELAEAGCCIVSGLALGIDAASHDGALMGRGRTIAVLGGALNRLYPRENRNLLERILEAGGSVVTEYPQGTFASRFSFPERNRIIAGLSLGVFVAEGRDRSGALGTASIALSEGREVFALPGNVEEPCSRLPHRLIAEGAKLITCGEDILAELVIEPPAKAGKNMGPASGEEEYRTSSVKKQAPDEAKTPGGKEKAQPVRQDEVKPAQVLDLPEDLGGQETAVCRALLSGIVDFDELCVATGLPEDDLGALLIEMELDGLIETLPGNAFGPGGRMRERGES